MRYDKLIWIPRALIFAYIIFLSIFAFDSKSAIEFLIHMIPSLILLIIFIFSWKNSKIAAILFALIGIITVAFFKTYTDIFVFLMVSMPPILISILFWILGNKHNKNRRKKRK